MSVTAGAQALARDQDNEPLEAVPAKPEHKVQQHTLVSLADAEDAALTAAQVHDACDRGCRTASLQSTQMAERVYAAVGFRDLGRILEYVPAEGER